MRNTTPFGWIQFGPANSSWCHIYGSHNIYFNVNTYVQGNLMMYEDTWLNGKYFSSGGIIYANASMRAPIFYDYDNAGYYVDPNSRSNLYTLTLANSNDFLILGNGEVSTTNQIGISFGSVNYAIFKPYGAWIQPLYIAFHTGIRIGAQSAYGGTKFYNTELMATEILSVGSGDNGVRASYGMYAPIFYDVSNTAYYVDPNETGPSVRVAGDIYMGQGVNASSIYMGDSDEGQRQIHCNSNRVGFLSQVGNWAAYCGDDGNWTCDYISYGGQSVRAPIFYDTDNTGYYVDPQHISKLNSLVTNSVYTGNKSSGAALSVTTVFQDIYDFSIAGVYIPAGVNRVVFWYNASARQYGASGLNHCAFRLRVVNDQTGAVSYIGHGAWGFGIMRQNDSDTGHSWWQYSQHVVLYPAWSDTGNAGGLTAGYSYTFYLQVRDIYENVMYIGGETGGTYVGYSPVQGTIWVS